MKENDQNGRVKELRWCAPDTEFYFSNYGQKTYGTLIKVNNCSALVQWHGGKREHIAPGTAVTITGGDVAATTTGQSPTTPMEQVMKLSRKNVNDLLAELGTKAEKWSDKKVLAKLAALNAGADDLEFETQETAELMDEICTAIDGGAELEFESEEATTTVEKAPEPKKSQDKKATVAEETEAPKRKRRQKVEKTKTEIPKAKSKKTPKESPKPKKKQPKKTASTAKEAKAPKTKKQKTPKKAPKTNGALSQLAAAELVLGKADGPLTCGEIIRLMEEGGHWTSPNGASPERTLYTQFLRDQKKGSASRFTKTGRGLWALASTAQSAKAPAHKRKTKKASA